MARTLIRDTKGELIILASGKPLTSEAWDQDPPEPDLIPQREIDRGFELLGTEPPEHDEE